jgi:OOP family OmpA-OmpF porin
MVPVEVKVDPVSSIELQNIQFKMDSTEPADATSWAQLKQLALALQGVSQESKFLIEGHTCSLGSDLINNKLSIERACFVLDYLVKEGVASSSLQAIGCGAAEAHGDHVSFLESDSLLAKYRKVVIHKIVN